MQALASLGMLEGEGIQPGPPNLDLARQYIDLFEAMLEENKMGIWPHILKLDPYLREMIRGSAQLIQNPKEVDLSASF